MKRCLSRRRQIQILKRAPPRNPACIHKWPIQTPDGGKVVWYKGGVVQRRRGVSTESLPAEGEGYTTVHSRVKHVVWQVVFPESSKNNFKCGGTSLPCTPRYSQARLPCSKQCTGPQVLSLGMLGLDGNSPSSFHFSCTTRKS